MTDQPSESNLHSREERPSGLLYFTRYDSVPIMVDALFDAPTSREFTQSELAEKAGLTPRSVSNRIHVLEELGIIEQVPDTDRFTLNLEGKISWKLRELDGAIKQAISQGEPPRINENSPQEKSQSGIDESQNVVSVEEDSAYEVGMTIREQVT